MSEALQVINIKDTLIKSSVGILFAIMILLVPISTLVGLIIAFIGLMMIGVNGYKLYKDYQIKKEADNEMLFNVLAVLLGFILICFSATVITIIVSIYLLGLPLYQVIKEKFNKKTLIEKLPVMLMGLILLISGIFTFDPIFKILGAVVLVLSLGYLGYNFYLYKKSGVKIIK